MKYSSEELNKLIAATKRYWLVKLVSGPKRDQNEQEAQVIQFAHLDYMFTLKDQGKLCLLGPTPNEPTIRGLCLFNGDLTEDEVRKLAYADPAVSSGRLNVEITEFYGLPGDCLK